MKLFISTCGILLTWLAAGVVNAQSGDQETGAAGLTVRVAAISFVPTKLDLEGNAQRLERAFRSAAEGGAEISVGPEGALDGYVVNEIIAGEMPADRMREVAIGLDHPVIERFRQVARELDMCLAFGFAERIKEDVYNCAVFIDGSGAIRGKYHKMQFDEGYDPSWWYNRLGKTSRAFDTPYGRCGFLICNDRWNAALARIPVLDGAQFLLIPAMGSRSESQDAAVLSRSQENRVPIVEANVGVTLIADGTQIIALDRKEEGITFGEITISPPARADAAKRDEAEEQFLIWRKTEMQTRLLRRLERLKGKSDQP
jgi:predicted amidohydrolase